MAGSSHFQINIADRGKILTETKYKGLFTTQKLRIYVNNENLV